MPGGGGGRRPGAAARCGGHWANQPRLSGRSTWQPAAAWHSLPAHVHNHHRRAGAVGQQLAAQQRGAAAVGLGGRPRQVRQAVQGRHLLLHGAGVGVGALRRRRVAAREAGGGGASAGGGEPQGLQLRSRDGPDSCPRPCESCGALTGRPGPSCVQSAGQLRGVRRRSRGGSTLTRQQPRCDRCAPGLAPSVLGGAPRWSKCRTQTRAPLHARHPTVYSAPSSTLGQGAAAAGPRNHVPWPVRAPGAPASAGDPRARRPWQPSCHEQPALDAACEQGVPAAPRRACGPQGAADAPLPDLQPDGCAGPCRAAPHLPRRRRRPAPCTCPAPLALPLICALSPTASLQVILQVVQHDSAKLHFNQPSAAGVRRLPPVWPGGAVQRRCLQ